MCGFLMLKGCRHLFPVLLGLTVCLGTAQRCPVTNITVL